ncbi:MAG TPA: nucleoside triphosphate pyrophosphohydrolase [Oligoflexia bacterium]|nr:nucleoside triphosphate pyrophosphohydrolase [Oligoflexia bacterium]HMP48813.1 nucleoside triphosphate pyrophosphohydrolase [Oligoflexia bacterium]
MANHNNFKNPASSELSFSDLDEKEKSTCLLVAKFLRVIAALRDPAGGCPWDLEQTHESLRSYMIEEAFEAVEAIDGNNPKLLGGELGDVLLQVVLHSQIGKENGTFDFGDVLKGVTEKMIRRHPHVFEYNEGITSKKVLENWEILKEKENKNSQSKDEKSICEKITRLPKGLPALLGAERIGEKAARWGFDWPEFSEVINKVDEEISELKEALIPLSTNNPPFNNPLPANSNLKQNEIRRAGEEIGDSLFTLTQLSRWLGLSAENLLRETMLRFKDRLKLMEENLQGSFNASSREEKESAWEKAKLLLDKDI